MRGNFNIFTSKSNIAMKQFFKFMFASMLGVFLSFFLLLVLFLMMVGALMSASTGEKTVTVAENSLLITRFDHQIPERTPQTPFFLIGLSGIGINGGTGLNDILANIRKAELDPNIDGIYLELSDVPVGFATLEEIRNALLRFQKSGKPIIAYGEFYSQTAYYLASVADKIYLHPEGSLDFGGLGSEVIFFTGLLEKLDIVPQVIRDRKSTRLNSS